MANLFNVGSGPNTGSGDQLRAAFAVLNNALVGCTQTTAEAAVGVSVVAINYGENDIRRYGAIAGGGVDCYAALAASNSVASVSGNYVYLPGGTYRVASNLSLSQSLFFAPGAHLKPDAGVTITIGGFINAAPLKIFDTSNAGSLITGPIPNARLFTEWWGAKGDGVTDDAAAIQQAAKAAKDAGYIGIQLLAKTYKINSTVYGGGENVQSFWSPSWYGIEGRNATLIDSSSLGAGAPALKWRGGSGRLCGSVVQDIGFNGNATTIGAMVQGTGGLRFIRCEFGSNLEGIELHNEESGSFTEYVVAEGCQFTSSCLTALRYKRTSGNDSFHGSGLLNRCTINISTGTAIQTDSNCKVYNSPLDVQVWASTSACTLINSDQTTPIASFHGRITVELQGGGTLVLGSNKAIAFAGTVQATGLATTTGAGLTAGTLTRCMTSALHADSSTSLGGAEQSNQQLIVSSPFTVPSTFRGVHRLVYIRFSAANYEWRGLLSVDANNFGSAGTVVTLATHFTNNTAAYGFPAFTVDTNGNLVATQAGWPASTVTAWWSERELSPGASGSSKQQF